MPDPVPAYIGLGGNLGPVQAALSQAREAIAALPGTRLLASSSLYRSAPVDAAGPDFLNAVLKVQTNLPAPVLLQQLQQLERLAGRQRPYLNAPRPLDLDVLLYGLGQISSPALQLPHPRMWQRAFVLLPLAEIAADLVSAEALASVAGQPITRLGDF